MTYFTLQDQPKEHAYYYATGIVFSLFIMVVFFHPYVLYLFEAGMKIRVGCSALIYKKVKENYLNIRKYLTL